MVFTCLLCQEEYCILKNHCPICEKIKRIINVYGKTKTLEILEKVCLRKSEKLQQYKVNDIKKQLDKKDLGDETYIQPSPSNNPNQEMLKELKKKLSS